MLASSQQPVLPGCRRHRPAAVHGPRVMFRPRPSTVAAGSSQPTAGGSGDTSNDDLIGVLSDAFKAYQPQERAASRTATAGSAPRSQPGFSQPTRGSTRSRNGSSGSSSSSQGNGASRHRSRSPATTASAAAAPAAEATAAPAAEAAPDAIKPKRKGRFSDLLQALQHESEQPPAPAAAAPAQQQHSPQPAAAAAAVTAPRRRTRIINPRTPPQPPPQPQQQQVDKDQQQQQYQGLELPPWLLQEQAEAAAAPPGQRRKQYKPVVKADLLLPGGPAWSALRRHLVAAGGRPGLPCLPDSLVLVEGDQDQAAVARAVNTAVYVCDGTRVLKPHVAGELQMLGRLGRRLVVLTDPDERGRELRLHLDDAIGPLHHAFVPEPDAAAAVDGLVHAAGNRGIEHVVPLGVQKALQAARPSYPAGRQVWSAERLQRLGLANAFDDGGGGKGPGGAAARRRQLCAQLGLGRCTAAQLVTMLNRFFAEEDVDAALALLPPAAA